MLLIPNMELKRILELRGHVQRSTAHVRAKKELIYTYCVKTLRSLGIFLAQTKYYAVLTTSVLPKQALVKVERWDGTPVWTREEGAVQKGQVGQMEAECPLDAS